jgi:two-component system phosphate regulon sensor histidine kinase PhoR
VDARRVCRQVCDKWKPLLAKSRIQLRGELTDNPQMVMADAPYLLRMLTVILENAWKYTPAEGTVSLLLEPLGARVRFSVSDTGIGIPLKDQAHIFDRFRRASNVQQAEVQGSGLGLALAAWIAKRHGAAIEVESTPGAGSLFSFELPAARIAQNIDAVEIEPEAAHRG